VRRPRLSVVSPEQTTAEPTKTEAVLYGTRIQRDKVPTSAISALL